MKDFREIREQDYITGIEQSCAPMYYAILHRAAVKAIEALEQHNYGIALATLRENRELAQRMFLSTLESNKQNY